MITIFDTSGYDIGPMIVEAARLHGIPVSLLLGTLKAESNLRPDAARYGRWPDISFGMCQMTVSTARSYGIGNGTNNTENIEYVRDKLFDRVVAIEVCAAHLAYCLRVAKRTGYPDDDTVLNAMIVYNAGHLPARSSAWWSRYAGNVARYRQCLSDALAILGGEYD